MLGAPGLAIVNKSFAVENFSAGGFSIQSADWHGPGRDEYAGFQIARQRLPRSKPLLRVVRFWARRADVEFQAERVADFGGAIQPGYMAVQRPPDRISREIVRYGGTVAGPIGCLDPRPDGFGKIFCSHSANIHNGDDARKCQRIIA